MSKVNILLIGNVPPKIGSSNHGGVARVVWNLARDLQYREINVSVAATGRYFKKFQEVEGIPIYGIDLSLHAFLKVLSVLLKKRSRIPFLPFKHFFKLCYALYFLSYINRKVDYELIHVHHVINQIPLAVKLLNIEVPVLATVHSYSEIVSQTSEVQREREKDNINRQLEYVEYLTHVSDQVRIQGKKLDVRWDCKENVVYNGIDFNEDIATSLGCKKNRICFVGSLIALKGVQELLESLNSLSDKNITLIIIGEGRLESLIREKAKNFKSAEIQLCGILDHDSVLRKMAKSCLLVVPSKSESFGLVYLEALSVGTPVIGYEPIIQELKKKMSLDGQESDLLMGFNHKKHSVNDLSEQIKIMIERKNRVEYASSLNQVAEKVKKQFSWENIAGQYISIYYDILD